MESQSHARDAASLPACFFWNSASLCACSCSLPARYSAYVIDAYIVYTYAFHIYIWCTEMVLLNRRPVSVQTSGKLCIAHTQSETVRQTNRQAGRQTDRQAGRQAGRDRESQRRDELVHRVHRTIEKPRFQICKRARVRVLLRPSPWLSLRQCG
eukprot:COSAG02_NODE_17298_length_1014_cov_0.899454_2_plen_154_part_00